MDHDEEIKLELAFLHEQLDEVERKIARLESGLQTSADSLETQGLKKTLDNAQLERAILDDLVADKADSDAVSLDAMLMQHGNRYQQQVMRLVGNWHRGRTISPDYWEAETKRAFCADLLRLYHAWRTEHSSSTGDLERHEVRPHNAPPSRQQTPSVPGYAHPWYGPASKEADQESAEAHPGTGATNEELTALRGAFVEALRQKGYPDHHLEIVVQPEGQVIATGYAHSAEQHELAMQTIMAVKGVT
ncbi:MAG TPA: hypothetical protein VMT24_12595, partial [Aggregatilineaceae bacterium]|nr:hypothetical protein [Aggregatilineaceae bacterium]